MGKTAPERGTLLRRNDHQLGPAIRGFRCCSGTWSGHPARGDIRGGCNVRSEHQILTAWGAPVARRERAQGALGEKSWSRPIFEYPETGRTMMPCSTFDFTLLSASRPHRRDLPIDLYRSGQSGQAALSEAGIAEPAEPVAVGRSRQHAEGRLEQGMCPASLTLPQQRRGLGRCRVVDAMQPARDPAIALALLEQPQRALDLEILISHGYTRHSGRIAHRRRLEVGLDAAR